MPITKEQFFSLVEIEINKAQSRFPPLNSLHEAYAVLLEEVDEVFEQMKLKESKRDHDLLLKELVQVASCALRTALDVVNDPNKIPPPQPNLNDLARPPIDLDLKS